MTERRWTIYEWPCLFVVPADDNRERTDGIEVMPVADAQEKGDERLVRLGDVVEALENGYHVQNPSLMHPADYVTLKFEGEGYEGLRDIRRHTETRR